MLINFTIFKQKARHEVASFDEAVGLLETGGIVYVYVSFALDAIRDKFELGTVVLGFVGALMIAHDVIF